jgi:phage tail P2-like protein
MSDLLPQNATPQEEALDETAARLGDVPVRLRQVWDPATCPLEVLPWLAWALSVDQWDPAWSEAQKRATIAVAIEVQQIKGTIGAVRASLEALAIDVRVLEWHRQQTPGAEYTYKLLVDAGFGAPVATLEDLQDAIAVVDRSKSLRSHLEAVEVGVGSDAEPYLAAASVSGSEIFVKYEGQVT